jgi:hypothetical protein
VDDFVKRIPDFLERIAQRIRSMTVDPLAKFLTVLAVALIAGMMVTLALIFLFIGIFRIVGELVNHMWIAYAAVGGLFLLLGLLLWSKRTAKQTEETA